MLPIERGEVLGLADYETIRARFRGRIIEEKRARRVLVGDRVSVLFENRDTVLLQIQEMLRTERITKERSIQHEIATYNPLVPGPGELSATLMIEVGDPAEREAFLESARGLERHVALVVDGDRLPATWDEERVLPDRASAVLYLKFPLTPHAAESIQMLRAVAVLVIDHPAYTARAALGKPTVAAIASDLEDDASKMDAPPSRSPAKQAPRPAPQRGTR
jgi:hypothetical protein